jgi:curved DNA-binding protein CbpA
MHRKNSPEQDPFNILGVAPSGEIHTDLAAIRTAYKTLLKQYHPDKNPEDLQAEAKTKAIINAYNAINERDKLQRYYALRDSHASSAAAAAANAEPEVDIRSAFHHPVEPEALVTHGAKVRVFVPMFIAQKRAEKKSIFDQRPLNDNFNCYVYIDDLEHFSTNTVDPTPFFEKLAENITHDLKSPGFMQVGIDKGEGKEIATQHSWYKRWDGIVLLEINVPLHDIDVRASEAQAFGPALLNAKTGEYFSLKQGTKITAENVFSLSSVVFHGSHNPIEIWRLETAQLLRLEQSNAKQRVLAHIFEDTPWIKVYGIKTMSVGHLPRGITAMRAEIREFSQTANDEILFAKLKTLAQAGLSRQTERETSGLFGLLKKPAKENSNTPAPYKVEFYRMFTESNNFSELDTRLKAFHAARRAIMPPAAGSAAAAATIEPPKPRQPKGGR